MRMSKPRFAPTRPSSTRPGSNKPKFHGGFRDEHLIDQAVSDPLKSRKKEHELSDHRSTQFHPAHRRGNPWRRLVQSAREPAIPGGASRAHGPPGDLLPRPKAGDRTT